MKLTLGGDELVILNDAKDAETLVRCPEDRWRILTLRI